VGKDDNKKDNIKKLYQKITLKMRTENNNIKILTKHFNQNVLTWLVLNVYVTVQNVLAHRKKRLQDDRVLWRPKLYKKNNIAKFARELSMASEKCAECCATSMPGAICLQCFEGLNIEI
jgi:hypothetical protein